MQILSEYQLYIFFKELLSLYGNIKLYGSATREEAFIRKHDFDIGIDTDLRSKKFLIEICKNATVLYEKVSQGFGQKPVPIHFIVHGKFDSEFFVITTGKMVHWVNFIPKNKKLVILLWWHILKLKALVLKKLKK